LNLMRTWFGARGAQVRILSSRLRPPKLVRAKAGFFMRATSGKPDRFNNIKLDLTGAVLSYLINHIG